MSKIRIFCNDGTDMVIARDKIIGMIMHKETADGGVEYYKLEIMTMHSNKICFQSNPALQTVDNYMTNCSLWSIYNEFVEGE